MEERLEPLRLNTDAVTAAPFRDPPPIGRQRAGMDLLTRRDRQVRDAGPPRQTDADAPGSPPAPAPGTVLSVEAGAVPAVIKEIR